MIGALYGRVMDLRNWAYDRKILPSHSAGQAPLISIGNLTLGGTGKTPLADRLARELLPHGRVGIVSRGYRGSAARSAQPTCAAAGKGPLFPPEIMGDEPFLLAKRNPELFVWVGKDKVASAKLAEKSGCRWILVDDGFQHRRLLRTHDWVVIDASNDCLDAAIFPSGPLRESPKGLQRATLLVLTRVSSKENFQNLQRRLSLYTETPVVGMTLVPTRPSHLPDGPVTLISAVGNPASFERSVESLGIPFCDHIVLRDHQPIREKDLLQTTGPLLCTEKDWVKLADHLKTTYPLFFLPVELRCDYERPIWERMLTDLLLQSKS